jgi:large subunit ribosomal protein L17
MLSNLAISILDKERVTTTLAKAKEVRGVVERLITYGKKGDLHAIRTAARRVNDKDILKKLFDDIAPSYKDRNGGYTRILKTEDRKGDNAPMAIIELVGRGHNDPVRKRSPKKKTAKKPAAAKKTAPAAAAVAPVAVEETVDEAVETSVPLVEETAVEATEAEPADENA